MSSNLSLTALILPALLLLTTLTASAQDEYSEITVFAEVPHVGGSEIDAVIKGQDLYLPVTTLFDFLKIKNTVDKDMQTITGFFINPENAYTISKPDRLITVGDKTYQLAPDDIIRTETNLFLKSEYFGRTFGLDCNFNFRSLSVRITSKLELPMIREMRLEEMRKNISKLKGETKADTTIGRTYPLFRFGMADWSAIATEEINGQSEGRFNLGLGAMVAGGEATANLYYNTQQEFNEKQQYYLWRYVNNDFNPLRQVLAGKIATNSISTLYNPVVGIQLTNTPTSYRRSFGTYNLSDRTEPGWIVELYVNNVLVDFVKADASGFFSFKVPLVYGNTSVRLKFYGPWGEERSREQHISIPFNFLPEKTLEYTASAGIVEDSERSRYSKINVNYGLTRSITIGGGVEYLSSVSDRPVMPFVNTSLRVTNNLLLSGEYAYGVRTRGTLTYQLPKSMQFDLFYTWYDKNQKAINFNYREERRAVFSAPLKFGKFATYQRLSVYQIVLPDFNYTTGEWLFSGAIGGINTNLTTYALFVDNNKPNVYSTLSLALRLPAQFVLMPQAQFNYTRKELTSARMTLEKHMGEKAFMNLSYEHYFQSNLNFAELGFRYDFRFAQTGASVRQSGKRTSFVQYARGSLINDSKTKYLGTDNRTNVGKGGISITPFIDINGNGKRDAGEPRVNGLNLHASGGRIERSDRDTTIRILGLEPYTTCYIEMDPNSFENISWQLKMKSLNVVVDPDIVKNIEIPVTVSGEVSGMVTSDRDGRRSGLGRIIVGIYNSENRQKGKVITEIDGYYNYLGLAPGKYYAKPDTGQLNRLGLKSIPGSLEFSITARIDGDIASGVDFHLVPVTYDTTTITETQYVRKDTTYMIVHEISEELVTIPKDNFAIQLGAFRVKSNAEKLRDKLEKLLGRKVIIIEEDGLYKVRVADLGDREEVDRTLALLQANGFTEVWVVNQKAKQKQYVMREIRDSLAQVTDRVIEKPFLITAPNKSIQIGAFREESRALFLQKQLMKKITNEVVIIRQNGYYKVRIIGFSTDKDMKDFLPQLDSVNLHNTRMLPVRKPEIVPETKVEEKEVIELPVEPVIYEHRFELPKYVPADTVIAPVEKVIEKRDTARVEAQPVVVTKYISLQAGVFARKRQAMRAQRRISSKLDLPVEVVEQWNYYKVLVRGFKSREETYKYYPELAGIGYPGITLIEETK